MLVSWAQETNSANSIQRGRRLQWTQTTCLEFWVGGEISYFRDFCDVLKIPYSPGEVNSIVHLTIKQGEGRTMAADRVWNVGTCWDLRRSLAQWRQDISYLLINVIGCILFILSAMGQVERRWHQYQGVPNFFLFCLLLLTSGANRWGEPPIFFFKIIDP